MGPVGNGLDTCGPSPQILDIAQRAHLWTSLLWRFCGSLGPNRCMVVVKSYPPSTASLNTLENCQSLWVFSSLRRMLFPPARGHAEWLLEPFTLFQITSPAKMAMSLVIWFLVWILVLQLLTRKWTENMCLPFLGFFPIDKTEYLPYNITRKSQWNVCVAGCGKPRYENCQEFKTNLLDTVNTRPAIAKEQDFVSKEKTFFL